MTQMLFQEFNLKQFRAYAEMKCVNQMHALSSVAALIACYLCRKLRSGFDYVLCSICALLWKCQGSQPVCLNLSLIVVSKDNSMTTYALPEEQQNTSLLFTPNTIIKQEGTFNFLQHTTFRHVGLILFITLTAK